MITRSYLLLALLLVFLPARLAANSTDTIPPLVDRSATGDCTDSVFATVTDLPEPPFRSNLSTVDLVEGSFNYRIDVEPFEEGVSPTTTYVLWPIDRRQPGLAIVSVYDKAGNRTLDSVRHVPITLGVSQPYMILHASPNGPAVERDIEIVNHSARPVDVSTDLFGGGAGFSIVSPSTPFTLTAEGQSGSSRAVTIRFDPGARGRIVDRLGVSACGLRNVVMLIALVGEPVIEVTDHHFGAWPTTAPPSVDRIEIRNSSRDGGVLVVTGVSHGPDSTVFTLPNGLPAFPLTLQPGAARSLAIAFAPGAVIDYSDSIVFTHNAPPDPRNDSVGFLRGRGIQADLQASGYDWAKVPFNGGPYDAVITLTNDGSAALTLRTPLVREFDTADFHVIDESVLANRVLGPLESIDLPVRFTPTAIGVRSMRITFPHDPAPSAPVTTTLLGIAFDPSAAAPEELAVAIATIRPNPTRGDEALVTLAGRAPATIRLTSVIGETLRTIESPSGASLVRLDLRGLAAGSYLVVVTSEGRTDVRRLVVER